MRANMIPISYSDQGTTVTLHAPRTRTPMDRAGLEADLAHAVEQVRWQLQAAKLAHDAALLRLALAARAFGLDLATAEKRLEDTGAELRQAADRMLADALRMGGWIPDQPDPRPTTAYKKSMFPGVTLPEGRQPGRSDNVLVNLDNGMTIVADADSAYDYHWEHLWRDPRSDYGGWATVDPDDIDPAGAWWNTGKFTDRLDLGGGYWSASADSTKRAEARRNLTTPDLPVDLRALLETLEEQR